MTFHSTCIICREADCYRINVIWQTYLTTSWSTLTWPWHKGVIYIQVWQLTLLTKTGTKKRILTWEAIHPAYVGWYYRLMLILTLPPHPALIHTNLLQMISTNPYTHFSFLHQRSPWGWLSVYWSIIIYIFLCPI